jgi:peptidoglycan/xylan/chitin deacetylase (PgdA/CDA1 family)
MRGKLSITARTGVITATMALAAALGAVAATPATAADAAPYSARVFTRGYSTSKVVTLTFDADWSDGNMSYVLQVLRDNGITAGFGLTGEFAEDFPDAARAIAAAGHKIINHSYDHPYFTDLTQAQRWSQLDRAEAAYRALGLTSAGWFRAPYKDGYADPGVNRDLALRGYYINFDWTYDTTGYAGASVSTILDRVRRLTVPGGIVVMHPAPGSTDPQALTQIISTLRGMGYTFMSPYRAVTTGGIGAKYAALGERNSRLGVPRTAEMVATTTGTAVQWYQNGRIYWKSGVGSYAVLFGILGKYRQLGTASSFLGFPITDETASLDGIGAYNHFQYGSIFWSGASGAHEVHGGIRAKWAELGWERGFLKYPISDEVSVTGGRASQFQGGNVYWSGASGAHEVHGAILTKYLSLGGTGSRLGLPTTDQYPVTGGARSNFQHGALILNSTTGVVTVIYT